MGQQRAVASTKRRRAIHRPAHERREEIVRAAIGVFARKGFRESGTAEIARSVGVAEPTLYRHFANKRALYLEALDHSSREILDHWREIARASATPIDALLALGRWYFDQIRQAPERLLLRARAETETEDPEVASRLRAHLLETLELVRGLYQAARDARLIDPAIDLEARTWLFIGLGALLDRTELLGLRSRLGAVEMARLIAASAPELLPTRRASKSE